MRLLIQHTSTYHYPKPATLGQHTLRLRPTAQGKSNVGAYSLRVPQAAWQRWISDPYGNRVARCVFDPAVPVERLDVHVELEVTLGAVNPFDFFVEPYATTSPFRYAPDLAVELQPFLRLDGTAYLRGKKFESFIATLPREGDTVDLVVEINRLVSTRINYVIREEAGVWTPEECLARGRGSCRDSAVLLVASLRALGFAARFVSGYLVQVMDEGLLPDLPKGLDHDVADLHAWAEVYLPGGGWIGLDATSGLMCAEGHIALAASAEPALAAPIVGTSNVAAERVEFSMKIARIGHEASPTRPYTDEVWAGIVTAGRRSDARLVAQGLVMTMGGEPTFNARENVDAEEWNGGALGPHKRELGFQLAQELRKRLMRDGVTLLRMGKHYPGESLPRWAIDLIGRRDGLPLWSRLDPAATKPCTTLPLGAEQAKSFAQRLSVRLGVRDHQHAAYEDPWHFIHQESLSRLDEDPMEVPVESAEERARLARVLNRGLRDPVGWAIPIAPIDEGSGVSFFSDRWEFRRGHLLLLPGESPMGLRLPLAAISGPSLPESPLVEDRYPRDPRAAEASEDDEADKERDKDLPAPERARRRQERQLTRDAEARAHTLRRAAARARELATPGSLGGPTAPVGVRTALCVEARDDAGGPRVFVFLPPTTDVRHFLALVGAIDAVRCETGIDVTLEGYPPPPSTLLTDFSVTPDPGVLEVNIPPTDNTDDYLALMDEVYAAALTCGLHSEKYMLDGRQAGSGGGHHLTLGGATPRTSPFLQRADLLASLLTFVQHHPSLSYMFGGLFIGPTSQCPRVDEARHDSLYELEIALTRAFSLADAAGTPAGDFAPWEIDSLFRNMLVDLTGNTHRAEISIDKLFDYRTSFGRRGIVEFRAFEMPPHVRLAQAQMVLVRCLVAALAHRPYRKPLVRWGQALHDRFLLPYWLWRDFGEVLAFLREDGYELDANAFAPFLDLRCPTVGHLIAGDVEVELRNAIEPWHVLGEEMSTSGTARYVDSSVERIELRAKGLIQGRHQILVNGRNVPMRSTSVVHEAVAGIRFRAWAPPHSLHAHLGIHHPLDIDIYDSWAGRSLGAMTYHVWHPEGRAFVSPPLTRFEASARRHQRVTYGAHRLWPLKAIPAESHPEQPYTMDLRLYAGDRPMPEQISEATLELMTADDGD